MSVREALYYEKSREVTPPQPVREKRWTVVDKGTAERYDLENGAKEEFQDFLHFIAANEQQIDALWREGRPLAEIFYNNFYSEDRSNRKYVTNQQTKGLQQRYNQDVMAFAERFDGFSKNYTYLSPENRPVSPPKLANGWVYFDTFGGVKKGEKLGRVYLNIKPEFVVQAYEQLLPEIAKAHIPSRSKIESSVDSIEDSFNRYDKMVLYFNDGQDGKVWQVVSAFVKQFPHYFVDGIPRFTVPVTDERGKMLLGVAFAEEPNAAAHGRSNGEIISQALEEVYRNWKQDREQTSGKMVDIFKRVCHTFGRDSAHPAFNDDTRERRAFMGVRQHIDTKNSPRGSSRP